MASNSRDETIRYSFQVTGNDQIDAVGKAIEALANSSSELAPKAQAALEALNKLGAQTKAVENFDSLKAAAGEISIKLQTATKGLADLNNQFDRTDTSSRAVNSAFAKAEAEVSNLTAQHNRLTAQVTTAGGALRAQGIDTEHLDQAHKTLRGSLANVTSEAAALEQQHKRLGDETKHAGEKAHEAGTLFGFAKEHLKEIISVAAAVEIALKGIEFGKESIANAAALEAQLSRVRAVAQTTGAQFTGMEEAVEKAAQATNTSSQVAAAGLAALVNTGKSATDAIAALVPTLQLAKIANIDVGQAADLVAKNLDAFNIPASQAAKVVDLLTAASHGSATALAAISTAAAELAPDARALGIDFDRTAGLLGLLSDKGLNAEKSVRALRTIFQELQNPTSTLRGELLSLGDGTSSLNAAVTALTSGTPRAHQALLTLSGGARTVVELLGQAGPQAIEKFTAGLEKQGGVAERTAAIIDDNLKGASTRFGLSIEAIGEKLGKPVLEPFKEELNKLAIELNKFAESPDFKDIEEEVGKMAREAARAIDTFLHGIDWKTFLGDAKSALTEVVYDLQKVADSASTIATAVNKTADVVGGAFHATAATLDALGAAGTKTAAGLASLEQKGLNLIGVGGELSEKLGKVGEVLNEVGDHEAARAGEHFKSLTADVKDLAGGADKAAASTKKHGDAAAEAAPHVKQHADATGEAKIQVEDLVGKLGPLSTKLVTAGDGAKTLADSLRNGADAIPEFKNKAGEAVGAAEALKTAFFNLHVQSQQALEQLALDAQKNFNLIDKAASDTAAGLADKRNAFLAYAQAALAASAGLDEGTKASVHAQLEAKASALGLADAYALLESRASQTGNALTDEAKKAEDAARRHRVAKEAMRAAEDNAGLAASIAGDKAEAAGAKAKAGFTEWGDAADAAALATQGITADTSHANDSMADLTQGIANARAGFLALSDAAAQTYDAILKDAFALGHSDDGAGFDRVARAMQTALDETNKKVAADRQQLADMIADLNGAGQAGTDAFGLINSGITKNIGSMEALKAQIADGSFKLGLLGRADLGPLEQALDAAIARAKQLKDAAKQADDAFESAAASIADAFDAASGNKAAVENRRYEKQLAEIADLAQKAGKLGSDEYQRALQNAEALHRKNLEQIKDEQDAREKKGKYADPQSTGAHSGSGAGGGVVFKTPVTLVGPHRTIHLDLAHPDQAQDMEDFLRELARQKRNSM